MTKKENIRSQGEVEENPGTHTPFAETKAMALPLVNDPQKPMTYRSISLGCQGGGTKCGSLV